MVDRFGFPKQEPQFYTELVLSEYKRPRPGSVVNSALSLYVRLPLPDNLTDSYNMEVNSTNLNAAGMINFDSIPGLPNVADLQAAGGSILESLENTMNSGGANILKIIKDAASYAGSVMPGISDIATRGAALTPGISGNIFGQAAQQQAGMVRNPHLTTLFDGVKLRTFSFLWKLSPKSPSEASEMNRMINRIKALMHPKIIYGGFAMEYPHLAQVNFIAGTDDKSTLPRVGKSFITSMSINNLTSGIPAFYTDGHPVTIDIQLEFTEINIKSREDFESAARLGPQ